MISKYVVSNLICALPAFSDHVNSQGLPMFLAILASFILINVILLRREPIFKPAPDMFTTGEWVTDKAYKFTSF